MTPAGKCGIWTMAFAWSAPALAKAPGDTVGLAAEGRSAARAIEAEAPPMTTGINPVARSPDLRQGGDTCDTAVEIPWPLPSLCGGEPCYQDTGSTNTAGETNTTLTTAAATMAGPAM